MAITKVNHPDLLDLASDTGATVFPKGTTEQRPVSPEAGYIRFNTTDNVMETYDGAEWKVLDTIVIEYSVDYLVIAGGGGGGSDTGYGSNAGGGGAGGYRNSYNNEPSGRNSPSESSLLFSSPTVYTITVGAGGTSSGNNYVKGTNGSDSSIDVFDIISLGGGGGGSLESGIGLSGGSGGGAGSDSSIFGYGTAGQGNNGDDAEGFNKGGSGGGAGSSPSTATGGAGLSSSITGSSVSRGGGGAGYNYGGGTASAGGGSWKQSGTANTGGGAGGYGGSSKGGGSGVVILRMPTANYSGTTTGSPTVTTDGTDTILTYTSSGTYTA